MTSITHAITNLVESIVGIFTGIFQAVFSIFHAAFATAFHLVTGTFSATEHVVKAGIQLCEGAVGFLVANLVTITIIGALFYAYRLYANPRRNQVFSNEKKGIANGFRH